MNNFKSVPVDSDTKITSAQEVRIVNLAALHQHWSWEQITAESIIFHAEDVKDLTDDKLFQKVTDFYKQAYLVDSQTTHQKKTTKKDIDERYTITRDSSGYTFVNFNFLTADDFL